MGLLSEVFNRPADAFRRGNKTVPWAIVGSTVLLNSVFEPVLRHFYGVNAPALNALHMLKLTVLGVLSYVAICAAFWLVCKAFGSRVTLMQHFWAWGASYLPTALCAVVVAVTEVFFYLFWNNTLWGMLLNFVFIGILLWKTLLFVIYLREFAALKGWRFAGAAVVMGVIILLLAAISGYLGIKTPVL